MNNAAMTKLHATQSAATLNDFGYGSARVFPGAGANFYVILHVPGCGHISFLHTDEVNTYLREEA
jgi:hypothetical protein